MISITTFRITMVALKMKSHKKNSKCKKLGSLDDLSELRDEMADSAKSFPSIESLKQTLLTGSLMGVGSDYLQNVSIVLINRYQ